LLLGSLERSLWQAAARPARQFAAGAAGNLGGFANAKSFATMQTAYYYIAGSPLVYDSSNPRHTPGRINYAGRPYDQKTCSTWWVADVCLTSQQQRTCFTQHMVHAHCSVLHKQVKASMLCHLTLQI
jgi:hypothetical protein